MKYSLQKIVLLSLLLALCYNSYGQKRRFKKHQEYEYYYAPTAVLVLLKTENRKITYAQEHNPSLLDRILKDAKQIRQVTINDFTDHFKYCPVYYVMDTNLYLVMEKKFEGVLLDAKGQPAKNITIKPSDTSYAIVSYGRPEIYYKKERSAPYEYAPSEAMGSTGLIIYTHRLKPMDYYYTFQYWKIFLSPSKRYAFESPRFDMEYYPFAKTYNRELSK